MTYLDTRDLRIRQQKLQDELDDLMEEIEVAGENEPVDQEVLNETIEAVRRWKAEYWEELEELNDLESEVYNWKDGETLIPEDEFVDYAQELAEDLGMDRNQPWPCNCIDWEHAADQLKMDYSSVEFQGITYLFRNC